MTEDIDEFDRRILRHLQRDATLSMDALAEAAGLSRNACWRRVKQMEARGIIRDRVTRVDPAAVGFGLQAMVLVRAGQHAPDWLDRFQRAVRAIPEIQTAHRMAGDLDYVLHLRVRDMGDYDRVYKALIARVPLADVSASFVMEAIKDDPALPV
ncbi:Lrp/AsnC family transcriptional regulator [Pseudaestuariivita atlantica]|uniref:Transcriptional regulator n=1 Tax=Pseudaestuariivita atlantica TaxID=1317121 RepID=A0A0L1JQP2_9RHOB|nr:Lrp/AsnC family transcriptional regulator [Pseudaestuariivita atlantica]KNG94050.1 transcriptional regulator [Pseudaestuariivita atlantica]